MKPPSKKKLQQLKTEASQGNHWEKVESFKAAKLTSIRLSPTLIKGLEKLAKLHGERSYQTLLKKWVSERVNYEMNLLELAHKRKAI